MKRMMKSTLAVVSALQLVAALPAAGRPPASVVRGAEGVEVPGAGAKRAEPMSQMRGKRPRRRRPPEALTPGVWGGERIRFEVTEDGALIEYDCAHGKVEGRIAVDAGGRFSVQGEHYEERAGPERAGESLPRYKVRLTGRVGGSLMRLTVTRADTKGVIGTYTLARGREAGLVKCL